MFVDFNRVFNNKPQTELEIPNAMVEHLNATLPVGVRYKANKEGTCEIISEEGPITIGGLIYKPTEEHKKVLGKSFTHDDVLKYSYNAQKPIPLELKRDGYILLNGAEFPIERMNYKPYNPISFVSGSICMYPQPFPAPFTLSVGCEKYSYNLLFRRIPNESVHVAAFESEKEKPLFIKYFLDDVKQSITFSISYDLSYAKTIRDVVVATSIYNAYIEGKGLLCGLPLGTKIDSTIAKKYDTDSILFWEKVLQLEDKLHLQFQPPYEDVEFSTLCLVEELYQNLINQVPVRADKKIDSIDGDWNMTSEKAVMDSIGKPIFFEFQATSHVELFGLEINLPCFIGIFNSQLSNYTKKNKKYKLLLEHESEERQMYTSILRFLSEDDLKNYLEQDRTVRITTFHEAKTIQEYIGD